MKAKKLPITIISTDWHLDVDNIDTVKDLIRQKCELAKSLSVDTVFCLGDIFESRRGLPEVTLTGFGEVLDIFEEYKITLWAIPGNHDKQDYSSRNSYLTAFKHHPYFQLVSIHGSVPMDGVAFYMQPYFKEDVWFKEFRELLDYIGDDDRKLLLLSHTAVNGSVNNDGTKVSCGIAVSDFKMFHTVLLGHYHNQQQIGHNVFHIPALQQNDFGENNQKGFTVVYNDGSFDLHKSSFKEFEKVIINLDSIKKAELEHLTKTYSNIDKNVRFEFIGTADKVKAINKEQFIALGIDVKIKTKEIEDTIEFADKEIKEYDSDNIVDEFANFCEEKDKDFNKGIEYLNAKLGK